MQVADRGALLYSASSPKDWPISLKRAISRASSLSRLVEPTYTRTAPLMMTYIKCPLSPAENTMSRSLKERTVMVATRWLAVSTGML